MARLVLVITFVVVLGVILFSQIPMAADPAGAATIVETEAAAQLAAELTAEATIEVTAEATAEITPEATVEATSEAEVALVGDAERGAEIFVNGVNGAPACQTCHGITQQAFGSRFAHNLGPNLFGLGERAGERVEGLSAEEYIHNSIVNPGDYLVEGFENNMFPLFGKQLTEQDIADLVAYAVTL